MKKMGKLRILILFSFIASFVTAQTEVKPEWIDSDISIFNHYFDNFPLDAKTTVNDLISNLERFEGASKDSIGFDGILHTWILPGGAITINSSIVSYHGKIAMGETIIYKPTGSYQFELWFRENINYPLFYAINKLISENRIDCIKNIIRGYSLPGRMYGTAALLQLAEEGAYKLSKKDKELIKKVLSFNLEVQSGYDLSSVKYKDCINPKLLKNS